MRVPIKIISDMLLLDQNLAVCVEYSIHMRMVRSMLLLMWLGTLMRWRSLRFDPL